MPVRRSLRIGSRADDHRSMDLKTDVRSETFIFSESQISDWGSHRLVRQRIRSSADLELEIKTTCKIQAFATLDRELRYGIGCMAEI